MDKRTTTAALAISFIDFTSVLFKNGINYLTVLCFFGALVVQLAAILKLLSFSFWQTKNQNNVALIFFFLVNELNMKGELGLR